MKAAVTLMYMKFLQGDKGIYTGGHVEQISLSTRQSRTKEVRRTKS